VGLCSTFILTSIWGLLPSIKFWKIPIISLYFFSPYVCRFLCSRILLDLAGEMKNDNAVLMAGSSRKGACSSGHDMFMVLALCLYRTVRDIRTNQRVLPLQLRIQQYHCSWNGISECLLRVGALKYSAVRWRCFRAMPRLDGI
jgi:hypothetical protein